MSSNLQGTGGRIAKWDNVKFLLIFLVVEAHLINFFRDNSHILTTVYFYIYTFHMPAFLFVSGLFMKRTIREKRYDKIFPYLILYFAIKIVFFFVRMYTYGNVNLDLFAENGVAWYAFAIFAFGLITMFLQQFDWKYVATLAVIVGCVAGYDNTLGAQFVLARITAFYPFFLAGYYLKPDKILEVTDKVQTKILAVIALVGYFVFTYKYVDKIWWTIKLIKGKYNYSELAEYNRAAGLLRFGHYIVAFILIFAIIAITPKVKCVFSWMGSHTLQIFAFHYNFVILFVDKFQGKEWLQSLWPAHYNFLSIIVALIIMAITLLPPFDFIIRKIIYPPKKARINEN